MKLVLFLALLGACRLDPSGKNACDSQRDCLDGYVCVAGQCSSEARWRCLDGAVPSEVPDEAFAVRLIIGDETADHPIAGAEVRLCSRADLSCAEPFDVETTDADGAVNLSLVDEYLEVRAAGYRDTVIMSKNGLEVLTAGNPAEVTFDVYSTDSFANLLAGAGVTTDPALGDIQVHARDCDLEDAPGVVVDLDQTTDATALRYLLNDLPSATAEDTDIESGAAFFYNAPVGIRTVTGRISGLDADLGGGESVIVRPGWLSHVALAPPGVRLLE